MSKQFDKGLDSVAGGFSSVGSWLRTPVGRRQAGRRRRRRRRCRRQLRRHCDRRPARRTRAEPVGPTKRHLQAGRRRRVGPVVCAARPPAVAAACVDPMSACAEPRSTLRTALGALCAATRRTCAACCATDRQCARAAAYGLQLGAGAPCARGGRSAPRARCCSSSARSTWPKRACEWMGGLSATHVQIMCACACNCLVGTDRLLTRPKGAHTRPHSKHTKSQYCRTASALRAAGWAG